MIDRIGLKNTKEEQNCRRELLEMSWTYLRDNFHKFTETNKIKIALTLTVKDMPQQIQGDGVAPVFKFINYGDPELQSIKQSQ